MREQFFSIGLMSGTSMDGIDAVLSAHAADGDIALLHVQQKYPKGLLADLRARIADYDERLLTPLPTLSDLHWRVGEAFARVAAQTLKNARQKRLLASDAPLLIGSHGQTIFHDANKGRTWQLGEPACIAAATGITTVANFRAADMANGGEGAPLLPYYHWRLLEKQAKAGAAIHNLGGISNFSYLGEQNGKRITLALDTGPANCMLDTATQLLSRGKKSFDKNGAWAAKGLPHHQALQWLLERPEVLAYRRKNAPKSTGRELFSQTLTLNFLRKADQWRLAPAASLATLTIFAADLMGEAYRRFILSRQWPLKAIYLAGGGGKNLALVRALAAELPPHVSILPLGDLGQEAQALEAQAFGYFAWCALAGIKITNVTSTGCKRPAILGQICPGENWETLNPGQRPRGRGSSVG